MFLNDAVAVSTDHILLVPYEKRHVPLYHRWMQNKDIQIATASDPLSIEEEYEMQQTWRTDGDKLTFIICQPLQREANSAGKPIVRAGQDDADERMLGDVNLFITPSEDDPDVLVGEIELMIAESSMQNKGYGRFAMLAFLRYVTECEEQILREYLKWTGKEDQSGSTAAEPKDATSIGGVGERIVGNISFGYLRARIAKDNQRSISLFDHAGFELVSAEPNYFGELEMRMKGHFLGENDKQLTREWWGGSWRVNGWTILKYERSVS